MDGKYNGLDDDGIEFSFDPPTQPPNPPTTRTPRGDTEPIPSNNNPETPTTPPTTTSTPTTMKTTTAGKAAHAAGVDYHECVERIGFGPYHLLVLLLCGWGNASEAIEILCVSFVIPELEASPGVESWIGSAVFLGMILGGFVFGGLADRIGRRPVLIATLWINALAGAASGCVPHAEWLIPARFVCGIGVGGAIPAVWTYFAEFLPVRRRGAYLSCLAAFWMAGSIATALAAWSIVPRGEFRLFGHAVPAWRVLLVVLSFPSALGAVLQSFAPESPKWLFGRGGDHAVRAVRCLTSMHRFNARWGPRWLFRGPTPSEVRGSPSARGSLLWTVLSDPRGDLEAVPIVGDSTDPRDARLVASQQGPGSGSAANGGAGGSNVREHLLSRNAAVVPSACAGTAHGASSSLEDASAAGGHGLAGIAVGESGAGAGSCDSSTSPATSENATLLGGDGDEVSLAADVAPSRLGSAYLVVAEGGVAWKISAADGGGDVLAAARVGGGGVTRYDSIAPRGGAGGGGGSGGGGSGGAGGSGGSGLETYPPAAPEGPGGAGAGASAALSETGAPSRSVAERARRSLERVATTMRTLWRPPHLRVTVLLTTAWFSLSFGYYGLTIWTPEYLKSVGVESKDSLYMSSFLVAVSQLPGNVLATVLMDSVGRGRILAAAMGASACCTVGIVFIKDGAQVVALMCVFSGVSIAGWNALDIVSAELYPCAIRSAGFGALTVWARLAAISGIHLFGAMVNTSPAIPATIICVALFLGSFAALLLPKTDGVVVH